MAYFRGVNAGVTWVQPFLGSHFGLRAPLGHSKECTMYLGEGLGTSPFV